MREACPSTIIIAEKKRKHNIKNVRVLFASDPQVLILTHSYPLLWFRLRQTRIKPESIDNHVEWQKHLDKLSPPCYTFFRQKKAIYCTFWLLRTSFGQVGDFLVPFGVESRRQEFQVNLTFASSMARKALYLLMFWPVRDVEAAGSNPVTSTRKKQVIFLPAFSYFIRIFALQVNSKDLKAFWYKIQKSRGQGGCKSTSPGTSDQKSLLFEKHLPIGPVLLHSFHIFFIRWIVFGHTT